MKANIRFYTWCFFLCLSCEMFSQFSDKNDSIKERKIPVEYENRPTYTKPTGTDLLFDENELKKTFFYNPTLPLSIIERFLLPETKNIVSPFSLYSYSFNNMVEGLILKGVYNKFELTDFLTTDVDFYVSGYYNGLFQPYTYVNASALVGVTLRLHDRVQVVGMGQISLREGINPKLPSSFGGANYYGAGLQFKVTKKIGFGIGVTNSYYRGDWTKHTYFTPVGY